MDQQTLAAETRTDTGTRVSRAMRSSGRVPGIIYGHGEAPVMFSIDRHELELELLHRHRLLSLNLDGKADAYLIRDVQYNHMGTQPIHLDLLRVDLNEVVTVAVAVELVGTAKGVAQHGLLEHGMDKVEVQCKASDIPEVIRARIANLDIGDTLTVADLELPEGVTAVSAPTDVVATIRAVAETSEEESGEEPDMAAEPEVISKGKAETEESAE